MTPAARAPKGYDPSRYPPFAVTVDIVVMTIDSGVVNVVLIERKHDPYRGSWALPGGFVEARESLDDAAARELREETGVRVAEPLIQIGAYGAPERDPRMRVVSVAYLAVLARVGPLVGASDAKAAELVPIDRVLGDRADLSLAFDHATILADGLARARPLLTNSE
jgi:8-oxo-dGTP diphosphatase